MPFKMKEVEKQSGLDQKSSGDTLFDIRHTKEYTDKIENEKALRRMSKEKVDQLSTPLVEKIERKLLVKSNSNEKLIPKKKSGRKRSSSINNKLKLDQETLNIRDINCIIEGHNLSFNNGSIINLPDTKDCKLCSIKLL